jgi:hypothetical protein
MENDRDNLNLLILSWISAGISIVKVQEIISLFSGLVAIMSGLSAIRYYYIKSKIK